ncbi:choice-of-anchor tandem repeat GloVer-containing protein [Granulicella sp. S190]|uniref:choice-of-anchor tandem repeat GloVer-containing protein n=1 Tax=Granulicella sp. S190 TaxID=1747226 RepID=UPI00131C3A43|nr:choice-of-anchor tandem repeat GloVer-containing protein [Granulicella sp. S190]
MWTNWTPSSSSRTDHSRKLLSVIAAAVVIVIFSTSSTYSQTSPGVKYTVLFKFNGTSNGAQPVGNLLVDSQRFVYGVTVDGGENYGECNPGPGCGVLYKLGHAQFADLHNFTGQNPSIYFPSSGLVRDAQGNLYGETAGNDGSPYGSVYRIDPTGNINVLHSFTESEFLPRGGLTQDAEGNLYGVTNGYCNPGVGCGEVFRINPAGSETVLYTFPTGGNEGSNPQSALVQDAQGNLYGTTAFGGTHRVNNDSEYGGGVLFKLSPSGQLTVLHDFNGTTEGAYPTNLVRDAQGNLYGYAAHGGCTSAVGCYTPGGSTAQCTTSGGGCGVVFKYDTTGKFSVVYTFTGGPDGAIPVGIPLLIGNSIYGATLEGGYDATAICYSGCGTVFKLDLNGTETVLHAFTSSGGDGAQPSSGLVMDAEGYFYGATALGGDLHVPLESCGPGSGCGTVYTFTLSNP